MSSVKDRIRRAKQAGGATRTVRVWLAPDMSLVDQHQRAVAEAESDQEGDAPAHSLEGHSPAAAAREQAAQLRAQLDECALDLTVRALSDDEWQRLVDEHPPRRKTDTADADPRDAEAAWNTSTFPGALLRAATVAPDLDDEDWQTLLGDVLNPGVLTRAQVQDAASAVLALSRLPLDIPFS